MEDGFYKGWTKVSALWNLSLTLLFLTFLSEAWLVGLFILPYVFLVFHYRGRRGDIHFHWNVPNSLTTCRFLGLVAGFAFSDLMTETTLLIVFGLVLLTDYFDGFLARKLGQTTKLGEIYDMEADALFVCLLSLHHVLNESLHWLILVPGTLKYIYALLPVRFTRASDYPPKKVRATIAATFFIVLLTPFALNEFWTNLLNAIAGLLIMYSFGANLFFNLKMIRA
ncbi:MAG: hypothetical protein Roseis2KO_15140 [Roseivirga sp.]